VADWGDEREEMQGPVQIVGAEEGGAVGGGERGEVGVLTKREEGPCSSVRGKKEDAGCFCRRGKIMNGR
jgi:hypothetical protein